MTTTRFRIQNSNYSSLIKSNKTPAFPVAGIKQALSQAAQYSSGLSPTEVKSAVVIVPHHDAGANDCVKIRGESDSFSREDYQNRQFYEFATWEMEFDVSYDNDKITKGQMISLMATAGSSVGIGLCSKVEEGYHGRFGIMVLS